MANYDIAIAGATDAPTDTSEDASYFDIGRLKRQFYDYLGVKSAEIEEMKEARRYYHAAQWTEDEIKKLKKRKQPVVTYNRIGRKIDAVIGWAEKLRQEPKAYPRTPKNEEGADVATAVLRYALDHVDFKSKSPRVARMAAIDGVGGIELDLAYGDHGDPDVDLHLVYTDTFFYDPRSYDDGFTDARFMGVSKWIDVDQAKEMFPDKAEEIDGLIESGTDLTVMSDRETMWVNTSAKKVRLVDHWYVNNAKWMWCVYIGNTMLMQGESPYVDEKNKSFCKFLMFSASVDHDGDRYGFIRNFKGAQDEINHRRSKALHLSNSRRVISEKGAVDDVERARAEWAKADGWIEVNPGRKMTPDDTHTAQEIQAQMGLLQEAKNEIENFGPNPALVGQGLQDSSGKAIALLQQAGIAELGPYILAYRTWKIRVYRALWNIIQRHWTGERWVRVTDDHDLAQFIQINGVGIDPKTGMPALVNALGALDVDIILDEGPDSVNMMQDLFQTLQQILPAVAPMMSPPVAQAAIGLLIEASPLPQSAKNQFKQAQEQGQQPDPAAIAAKQAELQNMQAKTGRDRAAGLKDFAQAVKTLHDSHLNERAAMTGPMAAGPGVSVQQPEYGPVPGATSPSQDMPTLPPQPMPMPGQIPAGVLG